MKRLAGLAVGAFSLFAGLTPLWAHEQHAAAQPEAAAQTGESKPETPVLKVIADYQAAMEARSVERLEAVVDPALLVLEGVHKNVGWPDYRDNHIGPEMREWKEFKVIDPKILEVSVAGDWAYVAQESNVRISMERKIITLASAETFILRNGTAGWRIKHVHFSGKKLEPQSGTKAP